LTWNSPNGILRSPLGPSVWITAPSAASATHMSDGCVAMHLSLVPRTAWLRLRPSSAEQPEPGWRLLHGQKVSRKYGQRVRCIRLPPTVAMLRICAVAPDSSASDSTG